MRRSLRIALVVIALLVVGGVVLWRISRTPPAWYRPPNVSDAAVNELADTVENRLVEQAHRVRPAAETWSLRVRENQVNAWLAARLPRWIANQGDPNWPANHNAVQVRLEPGQISIAAPIETGPSARTIVADIHPRLEPDGLRLTLNRVALGRIAMPGEPVANLVRMVEPLLPAEINLEEARRLMAVLDGSTPVDPVFKLSDGRRIRLTELRLDDGVLEFTAQTLNQAVDHE